MTDEIRRTARCGCGGLRVETRGEPWRTMICSCADCRRKSGSAFLVSSYWPEDQVTVRGGSLAFRRDCQEGRTLENRFCPTCGVTVWWRVDFAPGRIGIAGGCFDEVDFPAPAKSYWTSQRPRWAAHLDAIPSLERQ